MFYYDTKPFSVMKKHMKFLFACIYFITYINLKREKRIEGPPKQNCILVLVIFYQNIYPKFALFRSKFNAYLIGARTAPSNGAFLDELGVEQN